MRCTLQTSVLYPSLAMARARALLISASMDAIKSSGLSGVVKSISLVGEF
jgi:hypothetical protein